jgi:hypothetical protein
MVTVWTAEQAAPALGAPLGRLLGYGPAYTPAPMPLSAAPETA